MPMSDVDSLGPQPQSDPSLGRGVARVKRDEPKARTVELKQREAVPREPVQEKADPKIEEAIRQIHADAIDPNLRVGFFKIEGSSNPVIRVYNSETGEVVRQIPEDDVLRIRERFAELNGFLADKRA